MYFAYFSLKLWEKDKTRLPIRCAKKFCNCGWKVMKNDFLQLIVVNCIILVLLERNMKLKLYLITNMTSFSFQKHLYSTWHAFHEFLHIFCISLSSLWSWMTLYITCFSLRNQIFLIDNRFSIRLMSVEFLDYPRTVILAYCMKFFDFLNVWQGVRFCRKIPSLFGYCISMKETNSLDNITMYLSLFIILLTNMSSPR